MEARYEGSTSMRLGPMALYDVTNTSAHDAIIGAPHFGGVAQQAGAVFVVPGPFSFGNTISTDSLLANPNVLKFQGANGFDHVGEVVAKEPFDLNLDGYPDIAFCAPGENAAYVIYGGPGLGASNPLDLASLTASEGLRIVGERGEDLCSSLVGIKGPNPGLFIGNQRADEGGQINSGNGYFLHATAPARPASLPVTDSSFTQFIGPSEPVVGLGLSGAAMSDGTLVIGSVANYGGNGNAGACFLVDPSVYSAGGVVNVSTPTIGVRQLGGDTLNQYFCRDVAAVPPIDQAWTPATPDLLIGYDGGAALVSDVATLAPQADLTLNDLRLQGRVTDFVNDLAAADRFADTGTLASFRDTSGDTAFAMGAPGANEIDIFHGGSGTNTSRTYQRSGFGSTLRSDVYRDPAGRDFGGHMATAQPWLNSTPPADFASGQPLLTVGGNVQAGRASIFSDPGLQGRATPASGPVVMPEDSPPVNLPSISARTNQPARLILTWSLPGGNVSGSFLPPLGLPAGVSVSSGTADITLDGPAVDVAPIGANPVRFQPAADDFGSGSVSFNLRDFINPDVGGSFPLDVSPVPDAPYVCGQLSDINTVPGRVDTQNVRPAFCDNDGDALTFSASSDNPDVSAQVVGDQLQVNAAREGDANVTVTARDPSGLSVNDSLAYSALNPPAPPVTPMPQPPQISTGSDSSANGLALTGILISGGVVLLLLAIIFFAVWWQRRRAAEAELELDDLPDCLFYQYEDDCQIMRVIDGEDIAYMKERLGRELPLLSADEYAALVAALAAKGDRFLPPTLEPGQQVADGVLGSGHFGDVVLSIDADDVICATKIVNGPAALESQKESRTMFALRDKPFICQLRTAPEKHTADGDQMLLVMDYCDAGNGDDLTAALATFTDADADVKTRLVIYYAHQLITAIHAAAVGNDKYSVVHRDLKPDNIFLASKGDKVEIVVGDWGTSHLGRKSADFPAGDMRARDEEDNGAYFNFSPERERFRRAIIAVKSGRADAFDPPNYDASVQARWELGCTLLEIFLGEHPLGPDRYPKRVRESWTADDYRKVVDAIPVPTDHAGQFLMTLIKGLLNVDGQLELGKALDTIAGIADRYPVTPEELSDLRTRIQRVAGVAPTQGAALPHYSRPEDTPAEGSDDYQGVVGDARDAALPHYSKTPEAVGTGVGADAGSLYSKTPGDNSHDDNDDGYQTQTPHVAPPGGQVAPPRFGNQGFHAAATATGRDSYYNTEDAAVTIPDDAETDMYNAH